MLLAFAVTQLLASGYLRLVALDAAVEGAGQAALAGAMESTGDNRARQVLETLIVPTDANIATTNSQLGGRSIMVTTVGIPSSILFAKVEVVASGWAWTEAK